MSLAASRTILMITGSCRTTVRAKGGFLKAITNFLKGVSISIFKFSIFIDLVFFTTSREKIKLLGALNVLYRPSKICLMEQSL
jgi:hypothetical protein